MSKHIRPNRAPYMATALTNINLIRDRAGATQATLAICLLSM